MKSALTLPLITPAVVEDVTAQGSKIVLPLSDGTELTIDISIVAQSIVPDINSVVQAKTSELGLTILKINPLIPVDGSIKIVSGTLSMYNDTWATLATKV